MIKKLTLGNALRQFPAGYSVSFRPGVNLLVGDQGAGKSTILDALTGLMGSSEPMIEKDAGTKIKHYDFEKYNPRLSTGFGGDVDQGVQTQALFVSHGQAGVLILADLCRRKVGEPHTFIFDEPDTGMSIRSCRSIARFFRVMAAAGHQLIVACHNPFLMSGFEEVYSVEHRRWMTATDFIETQMKDAQ